MPELLASKAAILGFGIVLLVSVVYLARRLGTEKERRKSLEVNHAKADKAAKTRAQPILTGASLRTAMRERVERMRK